VRGGEHGKCRDGATPHEIRGEYNGAPRKPIDEGAGDEQQQRARNEPRRLYIGEGARVVADVQRLERHGDRVDAVAEDGDRLAAPQQRVVAMTKRPGNDGH
jgi:hypothetical protein